MAAANAVFYGICELSFLMDMFKSRLKSTKGQLVTKEATYVD